MVTHIHASKRFFFTPIFKTLFPLALTFNCLTVKPTPGTDLLALYLCTKNMCFLEFWNYCGDHLEDFPMQFRFKCLSGRSIRKGIITKLLNYTMVILYIIGYSCRTNYPHQSFALTHRHIKVLPRSVLKNDPKLNKKVLRCLQIYYSQFKYIKITLLFSNVSF